MENNTNTNQEIKKDTKGLKMFNKAETPAADDNNKKKKIHSPDCSGNQKNFFFRIFFIVAESGNFDG